VLRALLRPTGALYLHCDWHASHYLKVLLDQIFGAEHFRNEIVWAYRSGGASRSASLPRKHDVIFLYARTSAFTIRPQLQRQYLVKSFMGSQRDAQGRHYVDTLLRDVLEGEILLVEGERLVPYNTRPVLNLSVERTGFPTQKPLGLLRLLLRLASDPGDLVLDPFCGSGAAALAAESLADDGSPAPRQWIAIDSGPLAIATTRKRLIAAQARPFTVENAGNLPAPPVAPTIELTTESDGATVTLTLRRLTLDLAHHLRALDAEKRATLQVALTANWPALIDTWSVEWDHRDDATFDASWRTLRTRATHDLPLAASHTYATAGEKRIAVHLTDVFGASVLTHLRLTL
jgi:SAM-dependent methyltransferase